MKFYFAVDSDMIEKYGMPETAQSGTFSWKLMPHSATYMYHIITNSPGKCLDLIRVNQKNNGAVKPFAICEGQLVNTNDFIDIIGVMLAGDIMNVDVLVSEMTWIK